MYYITGIAVVKLEVVELAPDFGHASRAERIYIFFSWTQSYVRLGFTTARVA
jgi:hypothetical protein